MFEASTVTKIYDTDTEVREVNLSDFREVAVSQVLRNKIFTQSERLLK